MPGSIPGIGLPPAPGTSPVLAWDGRDYAPATALSLVSLTLTGALAAASLALTGALSVGTLTNGRVPFQSGGVLADSTGLTYSANSLVVGDGTSGAVQNNVVVNGPAGSVRGLYMQTAGVDRWRVTTTNGAETGSNAGSGFAISARDDAGALIDSPITITRAAGGGITLNRQALGQNGTEALPAWSFSSDPDTGIYRPAGNAIGLVVGAAERYRLGSTGTVIVSRNVTTIGSLNSSTFTNDTFAAHGADSTDVATSTTAYAANVTLIGRVAGGTGATPAATASGQSFTITLRGHTGSAFGGTDRCAIVMSAAETWTTTALGTSMAFRVNKVGSTGVSTALTLAQGASDTNPTATFTGVVTVNGLSITDAANVVLGTGTGTKIGTATSQKLGFWNASPVIQPASANQAGLTDSTTGTAGSTVNDVGAAFNQATLNNNFASVLRLLNQLRNDLTTIGMIKGAA